MRFWMLGVLAALCIVVGMVIYVPKMEAEPTFLRAQPTLKPMENVTMADREVNINVVNPLAQEAAGGRQDARVGDLVYDAALDVGIADVYAASGEPVLIDIASGKWNDAQGNAQILRPESEQEGALSTLQIEAGLLVLMQDELLLYRDTDEKPVSIDDLPGEASGQLMPMANGDCAYFAGTLADALDERAIPVGAQGRPVWLDRAENALLLERGGQYILLPLHGGEEAAFRLVY